MFPDTPSEVEVNSESLLTDYDELHKHAGVTVSMWHVMHEVFAETNGRIVPEIFVRDDQRQALAMVLQRMRHALRRQDTAGMRDLLHLWAAVLKGILPGGSTANQARM